MLMRIIIYAYVYIRSQHYFYDLFPDINVNLVDIYLFIIFLGQKRLCPCEVKGCRCPDFQFIPSRPEEVGEFGLYRQPNYDPKTWVAKCR